MQSLKEGTQELDRLDSGLLPLSCVTLGKLLSVP